MTYWEGASLTCANDKCEPYMSTQVSEKGDLTMSLGIFK